MNAGAQVEQVSGQTNSIRSSHATGLRIAVASSGLGHVKRGIETWAEDMSRALARRGEKVTLFRGTGKSTQEWEVTLGCWERFAPRTSKLIKLFRPFGGWRYGFGGGYQVEQTTFALRLWLRIRKDYDVLHVQDPWLALILDKLYRHGLSRPRVILAHGTEEDVSTLYKYSYLQHLAPSYNDEWQQHRPADQFSNAIPNFIDVERFSPKDRESCRKQLNLTDEFVVLSVAAIKKHHKRCDYLIREFRTFLEQRPRKSLLMIAGARELETDEVMKLGRDLLGDRIRFYESIPRSDLLTLYRAADVFVLGSLIEMMPIAVLEALACGLPVIANSTATLQWMVGPGGRNEDLSIQGKLAEVLSSFTNSELPRLSIEARRRACSVFSEDAVVPQILGMYSSICGKNLSKLTVEVER